MQCAVISDLHLGADNCSLVEFRDRAPRLTDTYGHLVDAIRKGDAATGGQGVEYLVLLGDTIDFSVASQVDAYAAAHLFFQNLAAEKASRGAFLVKQIIYVPGNHDFSVWRTVMHEANVVNRVKNGRSVIDRWSSPGLLDYRPSAGAQRGRINIPRVSKQPDGTYGGLYLDSLTRIPGRSDASEPRLVFNVVYPNLYIVDGKNTTLLTHGHYLEAPWSLTGNLALEIAAGDIHLGGGREMSIDDIVALNLPFAELMSASLGLSGPLMPIARDIQREYKTRTPQGRRNLVKIRKYIGRAKKIIDERVFPPSGRFRRLREWISDYELDRLEQGAITRLEDATPARHSTRFPEAALVESYHGATDLERKMLGEAYRIAVPEVSNMIVGHSHEYSPFAGATKTVNIMRHAMNITLTNTGGWLTKDCTLQGGIMFYDSETWSSQVVLAPGQPATRPRGRPIGGERPAAPAVAPMLSRGPNGTPPRP